MHPDHIRVCGHGEQGLLAAARPQDLAALGHDGVEPTVDAEPNAKERLVGFDVDVAGALIDGLFEDAPG